MGDPRRLRKKYETPKVKYELERIQAEKKLTQKYGLKNKKEVWRAESEVKRIRSLAKNLLTASPEEQMKFLGRLENKGLIKAETVGDVLEIKTEDVLNRRLQTIISTKFKIKPRKARQAIVHGFVKVDHRKVNVPSFSVNLELEKKINYGLKK